MLAVFGHATWKPIDFITLDGGLRYNHTHKPIYFVQTNIPINGLGYVAIPDYRDSLTENSLDPLASVTLSPSKDVNVYATYSTGKRAGAGTRTSRRLPISALMRKVPGTTR